MSKRTPAEDARVNEEYANLIKNFRPQFGNESHIRLCEQIAKVSNDVRLAEKQKGSIARENYLTKAFERKRQVISTLNYYNNQNK